jgi:hypothetical protein
MKILLSNKTVVFLTFVASSMPFIASPELIEGISYLKVFVALVCVLPLVPFMLRKILEIKSGGITWILVVSLLLIILLILILIPYDYRGVFGAPGRNNGLLSILLYICFTLFGIYVYIKNAISIILTGLILSSFFTCLASNLILFFPEISLFPALNFSSSQFRDNVDNFAPLVTMAFVASLILFVKTKNLIYLILQLPAAFFVIKWNLIQPIVTLAISISLMAFVKKFSKSRLFAWSPLLILSGYILSLRVIPLTPLVNDSSIEERLKMVTYSKELWRDFSFFPIHIDALSDFSSSFIALTPRAYLDDFHNVYLQLIFSFGLVIGMAIIALLVTPFLLQSKQLDKTSFIFPIYLNFFVGLFFSIASPNFMLFGFILIGYLLGGTLSDRLSQIKSMKFKKKRDLAIYLAMALILTVQIQDFTKRVDISTTTTNFSPESADKKYFEDLARKVSGMPDAQYKFQVSRNYYTIGECRYGDRVFKQLVDINPREVRISQLEGFKKSCESMPRGD